MRKAESRIFLALLAIGFMAQAGPAKKTSVAVYPLKAVGAVDKSLAAGSNTSA
jgi:hypothetical protein